MSDPAGRDERGPVVLLAGLGLAILSASLLLRGLTSGIGIELEHPGAQVLMDSLTLTAALLVFLARRRREEPALALDAPLAGCAALAALLLALGAARASHPDLAGRTALTWIALLAAGLTVRDLAGDAPARRGLLALGLSLALVQAGAGIYEFAVEVPARQALYQQGQLDAELALVDPSLRIGLFERLMDRAAAGPFAVANLLACALGMALLPALALSRACREEGGRARAALPAAAAVVLAVAMVLTRSKGGLLAGLGGVVLAAAALPGSPLRRPRLLAALLALGLAGGAVGLALYARAPEQGWRLSLTVRREYWGAGLAMWRQAPLLGLGPNEFREHYGATKSPRAEETLHAHNGLVQLLAETGLAGTLLALALLAAWLRPALILLREGATPPPAAARGPPLLEAAQVRLALGGGAALGAVLLAGFGDYAGADAPGRLLALLVGLTLALILLGRAVPAEPCGPVWLAAALGSCGVFLLDGLTDFGLHHAGVLAAFALWSGLAPPLGGAPRTAQPAPLRAGLWVLVPLVFGLMAFVLPRALEADLHREEARRSYLAGIEALQAGRSAPGLERLEAAASEFEASLDLWPWEADTWRELAACQEARDQLGAAVSAQEQALRQAPRAGGAWDELAQLLLRVGQPDRAVEASDRALACYPAHPAFLLGAARARALLLPALGPEARAARRGEALQLLVRAEQASETTRLYLRKLRPDQRAELDALRRDLERGAALEREAGASKE